MLCKKPFMSDAGLPFGCGQCLPCRISRRRLWTHRILLESFAHKESTFVTLTYDDSNCPDSGSLSPSQLQLFIKRLRKAFNGQIRYYAVGEYGEQSLRPHYHLALFGYPNCLRGQTEHRYTYCCTSCDLIKKSWTLGGVDLRGLGRESAQYIVGYVTKKLTKKDDYFQKILGDRHPEFARMSRRPGIGALALPELTSFVTSNLGADDLLNSGDVPSVLRHGSKKMPLGRYLRNKLRESAGLNTEKIKEENLKKFKQEMQSMFENCFSNPKNKSKSFKKVLLEENKQKVSNLESRENIYKKKGHL